MRIGFIGTGLMGVPMVRRLVSAGHDVRVFNRTREKAERLLGGSVEVAASAGEVFAYGECTILMLSDATAVRDVLGRLAGGDAELRGRTIVQMSTIGPDESREFLARVQGLGGDYLEAPVLGSTPQAADGCLKVMVGSKEELFARWRPLLEHFGPEPVRVGDVGQAAAVKLALNQLIAALGVAFSYSLALVARNGIDVDLFMKILRESKLYAPTFDAKLPRLLRRDFSDPHFPLKHLRKDALLARRAGEETGVETASLDGVIRVIDKAIELGNAEGDYAAVYEAVSPAAETKPATRRR